MYYIDCVFPVLVLFFAYVHYSPCKPVHTPSEPSVEQRNHLFLLPNVPVCQFCRDKPVCSSERKYRMVVGGIKYSVKSSLQESTWQMSQQAWRLVTNSYIPKMAGGSRPRVCATIPNHKRSNHVVLSFVFVSKTSHKHHKNNAI